ncbi:MAG TPA: hypothetical protein VNM91_06055 [Dehalococcoidia bacterium]|nr:hypothetical protein [Dehalococcoidia bacterium]
MNLFSRIKRALSNTGSEPGPEELVVLAESGSEPDLQLWHDILQRNSIPAMIVPPPSPLIYGGLGAAGRIEVRQRDVADARELLGFD